VCVGLAWLVCGYVISVPIFYDWDLGLVWSWVLKSGFCAWESAMCSLHVMDQCVSCGVSIVWLSDFLCAWRLCVVLGG